MKYEKVGDETCKVSETTTLLDSLVWNPDHRVTVERPNGETYDGVAKSVEEAEKAAEFKAEQSMAADEEDDN